MLKEKKKNLKAWDYIIFSVIYTNITNIFRTNHVFSVNIGDFVVSRTSVKYYATIGIINPDSLLFSIILAEKVRIVYRNETSNKFTI